MRYPAFTLFLVAGLLIGYGSFAMAETAPPSGTLQAPSHPTNDQAVKPPSSAPRVPVQKSGPTTVAKTPVVPPHGPTHPHKPPPGKTAGPVKPVTPPIPVPAVPPPSEHETTASPPEKLPDQERPEGAPLKLPRFASLRSDDVNMRAGPGTRYRIDWVYKRRDLPVEIEREFDVWRWVRDADGIQGWVHQATLMGRRSFIVQKADATLRSEASDSASAVAILKPGVIGRIRSCEASSDWCNVQAGFYRGYLRREQFWGVFADEAINP
jgi:SH3-like domain-containing protein